MRFRFRSSCKRVVASVATVATVAAGLVATGTVLAAPASAATALSCVSNTIYSLNTTNHTLFSVDDQTGNQTSAGTFNAGTASLNGLALTKGGLAAYAITNSATAGGTPTIYRFDPATGNTTSYPGPKLSQTTASGTIVMGGINPANGIYYFAFVTTTGLEVYGFDTNTNTAITGRIGVVTGLAGGNGDLVFDSTGRMYFVATSGNGTATANPLLVVDQTVPTTGSNATLTATVIAYLSPTTSTFNGISFDNDGFLYVSGRTGSTDFIDQLNPSTGAVIASHNLSASAAQNVDLASCSYNNSLVLQKNVLHRFAPGDQFTVTITGGGLSQGNTGTTSGTATGLQASPSATAGPVAVLSNKTYTITETASGSTNLANYVSNWTCFDALNPGTVIASGNGTTGSFVFPTPSGATGLNVSCSFSNDSPGLDTTKTLISVNGNTNVDANTQVKAGDTLVYAIKVVNGGGITGGTTLTDNVPPNTTYAGPASEGWSCSAGDPAGTACTQSVTVAGGATATLDYTVKVVDPLPANTTTVANTVTSSSGTCSSCSPVNPTAPVLDTVKTIESVNGVAATSSTPVMAGDRIRYGIAVTNTGGSTGTTQLSDPVPAHTTYTGPAGEGWSCASGSTAGTGCAQTVSVAAGATVTVPYTVTVVSPIPQGVKTIANTVTTSVGTCSSCSPTNPTVPNLDTVKAIGSVNGTNANSTTQLKAGDVVVYTITVTNSGGTSASTVVSDPVPANTRYTGSGEGWSCAAGSAAGTACTQPVTVAAGAARTLTYTLTVDTPLPANTTTIANTATSSNGTCSSCSPSNPTAPVLDTVKQISTVNGAAATPSTQVKAGDVIVYTVAVSNTGGSTGTTTLSDPVPPNTTYTGTGEGWSCTAPAAAGTACAQTVSVAKGATTTVTYTVTVDSPLPANTKTVANTVTTSTGTCSSCAPSNPVGSLLDTVKALATVNGAAATPSTQVEAGDVLVYDIAVTNSGGTSGTTVLSDPVPANTTYTGTGQGWSCASGSVAGTACAQNVTVTAGATVTKSYTVTVVNPLPANTATVANTVTTSTGTCSSCAPSNPTGPELDTIKQISTVNGAAATSATQVEAGDVVVYAISVANTGGSTGTTTLSDPVPAHTTYTGTGEGWSCTAPAAAGTACAQTVSVPQGATSTVTYTVTIDTPLPANTRTVANTVTTSTGTCSSCAPVNPVVPLLDTVKTLATVNGVAATPATQVKAGDVLGYSVAITNSGGSSGQTTLSDPVPANTTYTGTAEGWSCPAGSVAGTACTQTVIVGAGATVTASYTVTVVDPLPVNTTSVANTVTSSTGTCSSCAPTNPTAPVLDTVKTLRTVNGNPATPATQVAAGDVLVYGISVTNSGGSDGSTVLSDPVPANTTYTGTASEGWSCAAGSAAGDACTQTVTVAAGVTETVQYTVTVTTPLPANTETIANTVTTSTGTCSSCAPVNPVGPVLDTIKQIVTVNGTPADDTTQIAAGDVVVYAIAVNNSGGVDGTTTLSDPVPPTTTYTGSASEGWSCPAGSASGTGCTQAVTVGAGATVTVQYTLTVIAPLPPNTTTVANTVTTSTGTCSSCAPINPTVPVLDTNKALYSVNGDKTVDPSTQIAAGDVVVYTVTVADTGGSTGSTVLSDPVPADTTYTGTGEGWSCAAGSAAGTPCTQTVTVAAGATETRFYTVTVAAPLPANTTRIANTVTTSSGTCTSCAPVNPTVPVLDTIKAISSVNGKPADPTTQVAPGDVVVYTMAVENTGGSTGTTTLSDPVPPNTSYTGAVSEGWSCAAGSAPATACTQTVSVAAGATVSVQYTLTVDQPLPANTTTVANTVTTSTGTCSSCAPVNPTVAALDTIKTITSVNGKPADPTTQVAPGDVVVYTIAVDNTGGSTGTTTLSDPVPTNTTYTGAAPEGWSCPAGSVAGTACTQAVSVGSGATVSVQYTLTVDQPLPANTTTVANTVTSSDGGCSACSPSNPTAPLLDAVKTITSVNGKPADATTQIAAGDTVVYTITVSNTGGSRLATNLSDPVPTNTNYTGTAEGWSCATGSAAGTSCTQAVSVAAGATVSVHYTLTVVTPLPTGTHAVANTVTSSNGTCSSCAPTNPTVPDLDTIKTIESVNGKPATTATSVKPGDVVRYLVAVMNTGGSTGTTTLSDPVPANTTYTGPTGEGWSCAAPAKAGTSCTQDVVVASGATVSAFYTVTIDQPLPAGTKTVANVVTTSSGGCSSCTVVNPTVGPLDTVKRIVSVNGKAATTATRVKAGDVIAYSITVTNTGGVDETTTLSDPVPANTTYTGTGQGWSCASGVAAGRPCTHTVTVTAGSSVVVGYTVTVVTPLPSATSTVANTVTSSNGTCSACTVVNPTVPALTVVKTVTSVNGSGASTRTTVRAGDVVGYVITVANVGGSTGTTTLTETVPTFTVYSGHGQGWSCVSGAVAGTHCTQRVTVDGGAQATLHFTATVTPGLPGDVTHVANTVSATDALCLSCSVQNPVHPAQPAPPLPFTGAYTLGQLELAAILLLAGFGLLFLGRRRRSRRDA